MTVFEVLNLRYEFEEIVLNFRIPGDRKHGTLDNFKWFSANAEARNKKLPNYGRALEIANTVTASEKERKRKKK